MTENAHHERPWPAVLTMVLIVAIVALAWGVWRRSQEAISQVAFNLPHASDLMPLRTPRAPRLPDAPLPIPR